MKKFAFYLPQFHEIPENNKWWGKGFTEWTNVKAAQSFYKSHQQPKVPLHNYYNLLEKETVLWQTKLMHDYSVDGMIYYHYYFKGKLLLEKPVENLLDNKEIDQKFFFCWANHSWRRTWQGSSQILIEQTYGTEQDWECHFEYLIDFFKDDRYEKRNNRPMFMLFDSNFDEKIEMIQYFDKRCRDNGFDGICVIETYIGTAWFNNFQSFMNKVSPLTEFVFLREPAFSENLYWKSIKHSPARLLRKIKTELAKRNFKFCVNKYDGNKLYKEMIRYPHSNKQFIRGAFFEWDNTPRHKLRGYIITPPSKKLFFKYLDRCAHDEYVFINAWNEWAEGMVMEPTVQNGYKYLEWIREWNSCHDA